MNMPSRRHCLFALASTLASTAVIACRSGPAAMDETHGDTHFPVTKTDEEWRAALTPEQYRVLRGHHTERAFTSPLNHETRAGTFVCAGCGHPLFDASTKFESGTGWPSFWRPLDAAVGTRIDRSWLMVRTEVHCANCGGHLGHVFHDGPLPTALRYCINGAALTFRPGTSDAG